MFSQIWNYLQLAALAVPLLGLLIALTLFASWRAAVVLLVAANGLAAWAVISLRRGGGGLGDLLGFMMVGSVWTATLCYALAMRWVWARTRSCERALRGDLRDG